MSTRERVDDPVVVREHLTALELAIVTQVADLRLMTGRQIMILHFTEDRPGSPQAASRAARRSLERLSGTRVLVRLQRRIGGVRAGSASFIYGLGPVGQRILGLEGARPHRREPSASFVDHTLAITQLVTDLTVSSRSGTFDLLDVQAEPRCWRRVPAMGTPQLLRPDLFVALGAGEFEHRRFVEVDRGTEHVPAVLRKCRTYDAYYRSGQEQADHGVFPRVLWVVPDERRRRQVQDAIEGDRRLTPGLFVVSTTPDAVEALTGGAA
jgi:hypothetical protein